MARPNYIELPTRDLTASQTFFEKVFGMKMTGFGPTYACTLTGDVSSVQAAVAAGRSVIAEAGVLVNAVVIPRPHPDVYREVI